MKQDIKQTPKLIKLEVWLKYVTVTNVCIEDGKGVLINLPREQVKLITRHDGFYKSVISMPETLAVQYKITHLKQKAING